MSESTCPTEAGDVASEAISPTRVEGTPRQQVLVLGMHRSGTSVVTEAVHALGAYVGDADQLTKPSWENPRGFFERRDVRTICDAMLHSCDADWWKVSAFSADSLPHWALKQQSAAIRTLLQELNAHERWVVKEPRLCLLLPVFLRFLRAPVAIHVVRNPIEVAKSLRFRNGFPLRVGLALWEYYNLACLRATTHLPSVLVNYDTLVDEPGPMIAKLAGQLTELGVVGLTTNGVSHVVDRSLQRERVSERELRDGLTDMQWALWEKLSGADSVESVPEISEAAMFTLREFEVDEVAHRMADAARNAAALELKDRTAECAELRTRLSKRSAEAEANAAELKLRNSEVSALTAKLGKWEAEKEVFDARLRCRAVEASTLAREMEHAASENQRFATRLSERESELGTLKAELERAMTERGQVETLLERRELEASGLQARLAEGQAELESVRASLKEREAESRELAARLTEREALTVELTARLEQRERAHEALSTRLVHRETDARALAQELERQTQQNTKLATTLAERDAEALNLARSIDQHRPEEAELKRRLAEQATSADRAGERFSKQQAEIGALNARLALQESTVDSLKVQLASRDGTCRQLERKAIALERTSEQLREQLEHTRAKAERFEARIWKLLRRVDALKGTVSWRITAPLRAFARLVGSRRNSRANAHPVSPALPPPRRHAAFPLLAPTSNGPLQPARSLRASAEPSQYSGGAPSGAQPPDSGAEASLNRRIREAEEAWAARRWQEAQSLWTTVLDQAAGLDGIAARARMHISLARRVAALPAYESEISKYGDGLAARTPSPGTPRIAVFTALCGGNDSLKLPEVLDARLEYVLFSDGCAPETGVFKNRAIPYVDEDAAQVARFVKTHPHQLLEGYDIAVWTDADVMIVGDMFPLIEEFLASGKALAVMAHPCQESVFAGAGASSRRSKGDAGEIAEQLARYRAAGLGCSEAIESSLILFDLRDQRLPRVLEGWWGEIRDYGGRDELSLNFALERFGLTWHRLTEPPNASRHHPAFLLCPQDSGVGAASLLLEMLGCPVVKVALGDARGARQTRDASTKSRHEQDEARHLRLKLLELGFVERSLADLRERASAGAGSEEARRAAWQLSLWHADRCAAEHATECLRHLDTVTAGEANGPMHKRAAVLASESHSVLGDSKAAKRVLQDAMKRGATPDLCFAMANLEASPEERVRFINDGLVLSGVSRISLRTDGARTPYDRLGPSESARSRSGSIGPARPIGHDEPKVSVIIPAHNAERTLGTALESVLAQTWANLEIIVADDCSTDGTCEIVERYAHREPRIRLVRGEANRGPYVARNMALDVASGDFVTCNDADDWSHPSKLEIQARHLIENDDVVANTSQWVRMTEDLVAFRRGNPGTYVQVNMSSLLFRHQLVRDAMGYWDSVRFGGDSEFFHRLLTVFGQNALVQLRPVLSFGRCSSGSLTEHPAFGYPGYAMGARREYREARSHYFTLGQTLRYSFPQASRPFAIPRVMSADHESGSAPQFDVIIATDLRIPENVAWAVALSHGEKEHHHDARLGLIQLCSYDIDPTTPIDAGIRPLLDCEQLSLAVYGESVNCSLLIVKDMQALSQRQCYVPHVQAMAMAVVVGGLPSRACQLAGYDYDLAACVSNLEHYFGAGGTWFPVSGRVRRELEDCHKEVLERVILARDDWPHEAASAEILARIRRAGLPGVAAASRVAEVNARTSVFRELGEGTIELIDVRDLHTRTSVDVDDCDTTVIMPCIDPAKGMETAKLLLRRAGIECRIVVMHDTLRQGFVRTLNQAASRTLARYCVYLAEDAYPGRDWLKGAYSALEASGKGLLGFNDGKWKGRIASFGMVRMKWVARLYGGPIFSPEYVSHKADNELTVIARATDNYLYEPDCTLVECDPAKDLGGSNRRDKEVFRLRFMRGFDGNAPIDRVLSLAQEYDVVPDVLARSARADRARDSHTETRGGSCVTSEAPTSIPAAPADTEAQQRLELSREVGAGARTRVDVCIVTNLAYAGGNASSTLAEIAACRAAGLSVRVLHCPARTMRRLEISERFASVAELCTDTRVEQPEIWCSVLIVRHPLTIASAEFPIVAERIHPDSAVFVINNSMWRESGEAVYTPTDLLEGWRAVQVLERQKALYPLGPAVRDELESVVLPASMNLASEDWPPLFDGRELLAQGGRPFRFPVVIGRHARDGWEKWPDTAEELRQCYPFDHDVAVRIMGGATHAEKLLGALPQNWVVLPFGELPPGEFLRSLDVFVYFPHRMRVEAFGRTVMEAILAGLPCVLPRRFARTFSGLAFFCDPGQVAAVVGRLKSSQEWCSEFVRCSQRAGIARYSTASLGEKLGALSPAIAAKLRVLPLSELPRCSKSRIEVEAYARWVSTGSGDGAAYRLHAATARESNVARDQAVASHRQAPAQDD